MILLPKTSGYVKSCVWMYFLIEYDDLLGKYIWDKVSGDIKKKNLIANLSIIIKVVKNQNIISW